ncbi:sulfurtransferase [Mycolicibacterium novocastrense]|nr:sulfurtransferase [Mycolicibacterium novocastrense]KUH64847.1 sulfurtransferase [Mycolicibacterium novocastrense]KUH76917.1 sulfurtransferase [Mycolicibacterium novocastrense]OBF88411.1 sulfurtransferase [Mycobacterium sp. 852002-51152_SCH6134967]
MSLIRNLCARVAIVGAVLTLAGCSTPAEQLTPSAALPSAEQADTVPHAPRSVGPSEFAEAIAAPERVTINVHVPYEGDITGTDLSIPFDQIETSIGRLPSVRNTPLAVYCRTGRMSTIAATTLADLGYHDVVELAGGMQAWQQSGRELVRR